MILFEIFSKRNKFRVILEAGWKVIGENISLSEPDAEHFDAQLKLFYFVSVYYATVYQAAVAAEMSTSAAHYLARIQTKKSKVEMPIVLAAQEVFAAPDDERLKQYGTRLSQAIESIVSAVSSGKPTAGETETKALMGELYRYFRQCGFSAAELISGKT